VPGHHDKADAFNRVQRGHQAYFETLGAFTVMNMVAGLEFPVVASACAVLFHAGSYMYQVGYSDTTLDVKSARYKKGGSIKWLGFLGAVGLSVKVAGSMIGWW
jgi:MAPEG family